MPARGARRRTSEIGQWAIALGRTLDPNADQPPSVSVGIISALDRIWGKAIQTDAKVSPTNYGGPLVDLDGRVQGVLVPASPRAEGETAGFEWYDSGIGFAIPLEDVNAVLPRLKEGKDLQPRPARRHACKTADMYGVAADGRHRRPGLAGRQGRHQARRRHHSRSTASRSPTTPRCCTPLGTKYEGDTVVGQAPPRQGGDRARRS